jgi:bifunctional non-homologous end joining protein LigD
MTDLFQPMPLSRRPRPFNHPEWLFELKYDGFRALAHMKRGQCELISRNGHPFSSFAELGKSIALALRVALSPLNGFSRSGEPELCCES